MNYENNKSGSPSEQSSLVGCEDNEKDLQQQEKNKLRKRYRLISVALIGIIIVAVILLLIPSMFTQENASLSEGDVAIADDQKGSGPITVKEYTFAEMEHILEQANWSDWLEELPADIHAKDYVIQSQLMYSSAPAVVFEAANKPDTGYTVCYTFADYPEEFTAWQDEEIEATETRIVEKRPIYRYRDISYKTSVNQYRVTVTEKVYSPWKLSAADGTEPVAATNRRQVDIKYQYRYKDLTEWICCSDDKAWDAWSTKAILPSVDKNVRTKTLYRYTQRIEGVILAGMDNFAQSADHYAGQFVDVKDSKWYGSENSTCISHAVELDALSPTEYLCFRPEEDLTIGEVIRAMVTLYRIYNGEVGALPYATMEYVNYAAEQGLIKAGAYENILNEPASRKEVAYLMCKVLPQAELSSLNPVKKITDMSTNSEYYDAVYQLAQAGVISWPREDYAFEPERSMTRAEAASLVERLVYPAKRYVAK